MVPSPRLERLPRGIAQAGTDALENHLWAVAVILLHLMFEVERYAEKVS